MLDSEQPHNTDAHNLLRVSTGAEEEKLKIGQAPHHPLQLSGLGAPKLELFYMNQGTPNWAMQGGIRNLGMLFHIALRGGLWPIDRASLPPSTCLGVTSAGEWVVKEQKIAS